MIRDFKLILLNNLQIGVNFRIKKDFLVENSVISCSDIVDSSGNGILSFENSEYSGSPIEPDIVNILMFGVDWNDFNDADKLYEVIDSIKHLSDLKPFISYMTIDGKDVDASEYLEFVSLEIIY